MSTKEWRDRNPEKLLGYNRKWKANNREYREKSRIYTKKWLANHPEYQREYRFGSAERYEEAMLKYDGWCAFACDKEAELVHHLDGKSHKNAPRGEVDNSLENLLPLCNSCHTKLHHSMGYTRQKKRGNR